jgi:hypothetical protein
VTNIVAAQAGNNAYTAATSVTQSLVIVEKQFAWLDLRWELTDLQIDARTRVVTSAKGNGAVLTIRQGDAHDIAVFFTDPAGAAILMAPSALKLCIREKTNRRPVILETTAFTPADFGGFDPYYQISFTADNDSLQRFVAFNIGRLMAASYDITIEQGTDWTRDLFLATATQGAIDLTGRTFSAQIRQMPGGTVVTQIATSVVSAAGGQVRLTVTSAASLLVPTSGAKYDLVQVTSAGIATRLLEGVVTLSPRITIP